MNILAHRGYWLSPGEKNHRIAHVRAFEHGFGIETDIRDLDGKLVVSHDMPRMNTALPLTHLLDDYITLNSEGTLAFNIKSDGLSRPLQLLLERYEISRYFCFDMSVPDSLHYFRAGMPAAARLSEYEPEGYLSNRAPVLWIDCFGENQLDPECLYRWLLSGKDVCLVSPELHGRDASLFWEQLLQMPKDITRHPGLMLCTDNPLLAKRIFNS
ncbi:hypothetical protein BJP35_0015 [Enterobacter sp. J49]|uniref:hypothetical protein n=1 Tax=Enterobacter sp. J49 TaxID=1903627 RepID=UPI000A3BDCC4|nr:hypothetical protein [Enterobacter sp. J49]OUC39427.1 hypothetical protein BJP35_0015 [Enterobacter sp. J49]